MKLKQYTLAAGLAGLLTLSGCATDDPHKRAKIGAAVGAAAGAVLGNQTNDDEGKEKGAVAGAVVGGLIGHYMDKQQAELEEKLAAEQAANEVTLARVEEDTLRVDLNSEVTFDTNSASINPGFGETLAKLGNVISEYDKSSVRIVGHTDSTGSESYNQSLSERRAMSVSDFLSSQGVSVVRINTEGRGEYEPRADNNSPEGRQLNRRVEIFLQTDTVD